MAFIEAEAPSAHEIMAKRLIFGSFLFFIEIVGYIWFRPILVVIIDAIVSPNTSLAGLATFGQQIGFIIEGAWLIATIGTLIKYIILPAVELNRG